MSSVLPTATNLMGGTNTVLPTNDNSSDSDHSFIRLSDIYLDVTLHGKTQLLAKMANFAKKTTDYKKKIIFSALNERENIAPLLGHGGAAVTAVRLIGLKKIHSVFIRLDTPVQDAQNNDIDLIFFMLAPVTASYIGAKHLPVLASVTRRLNTQDCRSALRATGSIEEVQKLLQGL